jgi:hypothetical protein
LRLILKRQRKRQHTQKKREKKTQKAQTKQKAQTAMTPAEISTHEKGRTPIRKGRTEKAEKRQDTHVSFRTKSTDSHDSCRDFNPGTAVSQLSSEQDG